jgi:hypothetical protein
MWIACARLFLGVLAAAALAARAYAGEPDIGAWMPPGQYRLEMRFAANTKLPWLGRAETFTTTTARVQVAHEDGALVQRHRVCDVRDETLSRWRGLSYPPALIDALPITHVRPVLTQTAGGLAYHADLGREWLGAAPADSLPRTPDDPQVLDSDGDGLPGVTLRVRLVTGEAELLVAQRTRAVLLGTVVSPGRVTGLVEMREFAQAILAAKPRFLRFTPDVRYDRDRSTFELVRDGEAGCPARAAGAQSVAVSPSGARAPAPR